MTGYLKKCKSLFVIFLSMFFISGCASVTDLTTNLKLQEINNQKNLRMEELKELGIETFKYSYNCTDEELDSRFNKISSDRWLVYFTNPEDYGKKDVLGVYKEEYKTPENWGVWNSRYSYPLAFEYNLAYENYNASIILSNNIKFLAIEAPSSENIDNFYSLIDNYDISCFVKLNSTDEYNEDYYPFWEENKDGDNHIKIGENSMGILTYEWPHRQGADIPTLFNLVKNAQDIFDETDFMAVSCRAGAGRTGTFIASYIIIDKIDKQLKDDISPDNIDLDIDEIVWEVTVQRPFAITHKDQYKTLYRLADYYIQSKK